MHRMLVPMIALLAVFATGFSLETWEANRSHHLRELAALAEVGAASLDSYLGKFEATLRSASEELLAPGGRGNVPLQIRKMLRRSYPELENLSIVTLEQEMAANAGSGRLGRAVFPAPAVYAAKRGGIVIERPMWLAATRNWVIPVRYATRDERGSMLQAIDASLPLSTAYNLWKDAPLPEGGRLGVIRDDGHLVTLYPLPEQIPLDRLYGIARTGSPLYAHIRDNNFPSHGIVEGDGSLNGKTRLWVYRRLEHYPLTLYTSLPQAFLWRTWWEYVRYSYVLLALGMVGAALIHLRMVHRQRSWEISREKSEQRIRRLNHALAQRVGQLEASNKELEAFSYTVSHDLRGPLRAIHGFSDRLAQSAGALDEESAHYLRRITVGAQRMSDLIDGLLQLSRVAQVKMERQPVDLTHEANSIARELSQLAPEREVRFTAEPGLKATGSRALLRDLLRNLLDNAWKFTAGRPDAAIELCSETRDGERVFVVRDNGVGFDMQYARKLFSAFQRLHGADYEGVGIGLASAARIVSMHGGRIWAEAAKNEGASFYFVLEPRG